MSTSQSKQTSSSNNRASQQNQSSTGDQSLQYSQSMQQNQASQHNRPMQHHQLPQHNGTMSQTPQTTQATQATQTIQTTQAEQTTRTSQTKLSTQITHTNTQIAQTHAHTSASEPITPGTPTTTTTKTTDSWQTVNRVVFPVESIDTIMPLYAVQWHQPQISAQVFQPLSEVQQTNILSRNNQEVQNFIAESLAQSTAASDFSHSEMFTTEGRRSITVAAQQHVSLCTFFNAFPASYWRRWTDVDQVQLVFEAQGQGEIIIMRSNARGLASEIDRIVVDSDAVSTQFSTIVPITGMIDGGFVWFEVMAGQESEITIRQAQWQVETRYLRTASTHSSITPAEASLDSPSTGIATPATASTQSATLSPAPSTISIAITTFNRPSYAHAQLKAIVAEPELRERLDTIYCVDQGTDLVQNQPDFDQTAKELGSQLTYLRQTNLGGSGGYSRGMYETMKAGTSSYVQLLDDDAISEPEAILRALNFADYTRKPTLVGGGMFHIDNRTILMTLGEHWNPATNMHGAIPGRPYNHDFAKHQLIDSPNWHQRVEADYNAWWMCLIPTAVIHTIGLGLPVFIKHDDIEFGLRAREHGYRTIALPGVAVWHQAWHDKDPLRSWEEYFVLRNRWIQGLLHLERPTLAHIREMLAGDINAGCKLTYSAMELRHMALRDMLRGPQYIIDTFPTIISQVNAARQGFDDTTTLDISNADTTPEAERTYTNTEHRLAHRAYGLFLLKTIARTVLGNGDGTHHTRPQVEIPYKDANWMAFSGVDSALVTTPDGDHVQWFRRDSKRYRKLLNANLSQINYLLKHWAELRDQYRNADMTSMATWERIFEHANIADMCNK